MNRLGCPGVKVETSTDLHRRLRSARPVLNGAWMYRLSPAAMSVPAPGQPPTGEMMSATRQAPWTEAEVAALSRWQSGSFHPFTCPNRSEGHRVTTDKGVLTPTTQDWVCPDCDYIQDWAHDFMVDAHLWI